MQPAPGNSVHYRRTHARPAASFSPRRTLTALVSLTLLLAALAAASDIAAQSGGIESPPPQSPTGNLLDRYIRDALRANLSLAQDQLDEDRATASVREARALRVPSVSFSSRRSKTDGGLDLGDLVNPAYRALNQLTGSTAFPTNVGVTLPFAQETRVRVAQPIYQPAIGAGIRAATAARDAQSAATRAAARRLAAEVQTSYWALASAQ